MSNLYFQQQHPPPPQEYHNPFQTAYASTASFSVPPAPTESFNSNLCTTSTIPGPDFPTYGSLQSGYPLSQPPYGYNTNNTSSSKDIHRAYAPQAPSAYPSSGHPTSGHTFSTSGLPSPVGRPSSSGSSSQSSGSARDDMASLAKDKRPYRKSKQPPIQCAACGAPSTPEWRKGPTGLRTLCNACGLQWGKQFPKGAASQAEAQSQLALLAEARRTRRWNPASGANPSSGTPSDAAASATIPARQSSTSTTTNRTLAGSKSSSSLLGGGMASHLPRGPPPAEATLPSPINFSGLGLDSPSLPPSPADKLFPAYSTSTYGAPNAAGYGPPSPAYQMPYSAPVEAPRSSTNRGSTVNFSGNAPAPSMPGHPGLNRKSSGSMGSVSTTDRSLARAKSMATLGSSSSSNSAPRYGAFQQSSFQGIPPSVAPQTNSMNRSASSTFTMPTFKPAYGQR